jgi:ATP-dependent protease ClpP protease subunit
MVTARYDTRTIARRFGAFLALLDAGADMTGTNYTSEEADLSDLEGLTPELAAALTRKATAESQIAEAKATEAKLQLKNIQASDDYNRVLNIVGPIMETDEYIATLQRWARRDPGKPITIYLSTPGGSIFDSNALGAVIRQLQAKGTKFTIFGQGTVFSMGAVLLQYADERVLAKDAIFMIHSLSGGAHGQIESIMDTTEMWKGVNDRLLDILTERAHITKAALKKKVARKELFLDAAKAFEMGFCDRVE